MKVSNPEKAPNKAKYQRKEYHKKYHKDHTAERSGYYKVYYENNKEKILERRKKNKHAAKIISESKKPPIGLTPKYIHDEKRFSDVCDAIQRYLSGNLKIPVEWVDEYNSSLKNTKL